MDNDGFQESLHCPTQYQAFSVLIEVDIGDHRRRIARIHKVHEHPVQPILMYPGSGRTGGLSIRSYAKLMDINGVRVIRQMRTNHRDVRRNDLPQYRVSDKVLALIEN